MGTGTGAAAGSRGVGGGGIEALGSVRRRAATGGGGGGGDFREVIFVTNCFARSNQPAHGSGDRKSTRLNSSHSQISYAVFCLKKKKKNQYALYTTKRH